MTLFQRIIFLIFFNSSLFILLIIGLQNNLKKTKVNFIFNETVVLPIGFVCGASFISGSITGSFLSLKFRNKKKLTT